jgi:hypothetical protein
MFGFEIEHAASGLVLRRRVKTPQNILVHDRSPSADANSKGRARGLGAGCSETIETILLLRCLRRFERKEKNSALSQAENK